MSQAKKHARAETYNAKRKRYKALEIYYPKFSKPVCWDNFDISPRWKYLKIKVLDLSKNNITNLPKELGTFPYLKKLNLSENLLGMYTETKWEWLEQTTIQKNLRSLNISNNSFVELPLQIGKLTALRKLIIGFNNLSSLPQNIGCLKSLKYLDLSLNDLSFLPGTITHLKYKYLDISCNPFLFRGDYYIDNKKLPSLVELSARCIIQYRIAYNSRIIPWTLVEYLDNANYCFICKQTCFDTYIVKFVSWTYENDKVNNNIRIWKGK